ncbi:Ig-like domain-containing protein [Adhaeribacter soli]|uniref:T9SS type A sorting domain-containing protein n=1 Tax=Adhaeribacter soli TaxID=2607655 RepID=A0A5N1J4U3_9BACT|nr:T9SS type A sorting domain-containing protein [Adhaeribacter soli]KAA9345714.1 T9SS type A sorting domain-containing protein [Adhaeribacter soli]
MKAAAQAVPANDNCSGAFLITPNQACTPVSGGSVGATQSMLACGTGGVADDDVWFKFVATRKQHAVKVTPSAGYDAVLEVFSGSCGNLNSLVCTDVASNGQAETAQPANLIIGNTYYVRVYHYKAGAGTSTFTICVSDPNNDYCEGAEELFPGNTCSTVSGNLLNATQSLPPCGGFSGTAKDVWYKFTATGLAHDVTVVTTGSSGASVEAFSGNSCNSLTSLKCKITIGSSHTMELAPLVPGKTYFIRVYTTGNVTTSQPFTICVKNRTLPDGALCENAVDIPAIPFTSGVQTTCGKGDFYRGNFLNYVITGEEMVYKLVVTNAPVSYLVKLDQNVSPGERYAVSVFQDCPTPAVAPGNFVGDSPISNDSSTITLNSNGTYYFVVDKFGSGSACGNFNLSILPIPKPPINDECINAISLTVGKTCIPYNATSAYATQSMPGITFPPVNRNKPTVADDDVWFSFVAKSTKHKIVLEPGSMGSYDDVVQLFSGTCNNLSNLEASYSGVGIYDINADSLIIGQTYYLRVYDSRSSWGSGRFSICVTEYIENDECSGAITLPVQPVNATPVPQFATTSGATQSLPACTGSVGYTFPNDDVWFKFTATSAYQFIKVTGLDVNGQAAEMSSFIPSLELYNGTCGSLNSLVCATPTFWPNTGEIHTSNLIPGNTYYFRVFEQQQGIYYDKFTVYVQEEQAPVQGDLCSNAIPINSYPFNSGTFTTCNANNDYNGNCRLRYKPFRDLVFKMEVTNAPAMYKLSLTSTGTQKLVGVYAGCPSPAFSPSNCVEGEYFEFNYREPSTLTADRDSTVSEVYNFTANGTYYVVVEDYEQINQANPGECGEFNLTVNPITPPVNDACANAILLSSGSVCMPVSGNSAGARRNPGAGICSSPYYYFDENDDDVWYKFVATSTNHSITVQGSAGYWPGVSILTGTCTNFTAFKCETSVNPSGTKIINANNLVVGQTYFIMVFEQRVGFGISGNFTICLTDGAAPQPPGSTCANAVPIPAVPFNSGLQSTCGKGNDYGVLTLDSRTNPAIPSNYGFGEDMVYKLSIANAPVTYKITIAGPERWKVIRINKACPFTTAHLPLTTGSDTTASANFTFTTNGDYYIVVDKWAGPNDPVCGSFRLLIEPAVYPSNDECAGAISLPVNAVCTPVKGNLAMAVATPKTCYTTMSDQDVWYKFTAPASRNVTISASATATFRPGVEMYQDTCGALKSMGCPDWNEDTVFTKNFYKLNPGQIYYLRVVNYLFRNNGSGEFSICVTSIPEVINSTCGGAVTLPVNAPNVCNAVNGTTTGSFAEPNLQGCSGTADDNAWYKFTATSQSHRVQVKGAIGFDPVVELFNGTCGSITPITCTDNTGISLTENLDVNGLTVGQTYFVRVYNQGPGYGSGNFSICVQERPLPPINDHCVNAITLAADTVCNPVAGTVLNATESLRGCSGTAATDVWYKFTALGPENTITVTNAGDADLVAELLSGSCNAPNSVMCRDTAIAGGNEVIKFAGTIVGRTYYVRVYAYNQEITNGDFTICVKSNSVRSVVLIPPALSIFCAGNQFKLPFEIFGQFNAANVLQAQLSDSAGNFNFLNPIIVGSKATAVSDTFTITLPANSKKSSLYKIRVIATSPAYTSPVTMPLSVNAIPNPPQFVKPPEYCHGETIAPLRATGSNLRWYADAQLKQLVHSGITFTPPQLTDTTNYYLTQTTTGCESLPAILKVIVKPRPNTFFAGLDSVYCASTQSITLTPAVAGGTFSGGLVFGNTFIPALSGNHTITYTLTQNGCTATETRKVKVMPSPPALTGGNQTICSGSSVQIGMTPNAGFSYAWTPVAGLSNPLIANPVFTGINPNAQNDTVVKVLHVTDLVNGCTSTSYLKIVVKGVAPITLPASQSVCADRLPMQLSASPAGGTWTGNGIIATGLFDPFMAGLGRHKLVYNIQQNGCTRSDSTFITVTPTPLASAGRDTTICAGSSVTLGVPAVAGYTYQWSPGTFLDNPAAAQPVFTNSNLTSPATFVKTLTVTNTSTGCTSTSQVQITVNPLPVVNAGPDASLCANAGIYQLNGRPLGGTWTGSAGISGTAFDPAAATPGINRLAYTFNLNGCSVTDSVKLTVLPAPAAFAGHDTLVCSGEPVALGTSGVPGFSYRWSPAAGLTSPFISNPTFTQSNHTVQADTLLKVLTKTNLATNCSSTDTVQIIVKPVPVVSAGANASVCANSGLYQLTPTPAGGTWSGSPHVSGNTFDPLTAGAGLHKLVYTFTSNGCTVKDSIEITVKPTPVASAGSDQIMCSGETITLGSSPTPGYGYIWSPANGLSNSQLSNPTFIFTNFNPLADTLIKVLTVTDFATGCSSTHSVRIIVKPNPVIAAVKDTTVCISESMLTLRGSPAGGTWSGSNALTGNNFNLTAAGAGKHPLVYTYTMNGCLASASTTVTILAAPAKPVINLINLDSLGSSVNGTAYQWLLNGKALTANAPGIKPKEYGMYQVIVWNALCISDTSAAYNYQPASLPEQPEGFRLYPNPSAGKTKLEFRQQGTHAVNLTIFDSIGRPFYKKRLLANAQGIINEELQLRSLRNGIYLLQLTDGSKTWIKKLVIEK